MHSNNKVLTGLIMVIAIIMVAAVLRFASQVFIPFAVSIIFLFVFSPMVVFITSKITPAPLDSHTWGAGGIYVHQRRHRGGGVFQHPVPGRPIPRVCRAAGDAVQYPDCPIRTSRGRTGVRL